ncbi:Transmembrane protein 104 [Strongyloides ratti]|uniref:Transmembrane protein 104 n=1 Tax=Strongyloides ratti TaxID=34506 RepID=A0A090LVF7_STRRB|nr:Transmembrane protein 104 [Strongyloides ratti]CEF71644.1 Transmembrane protein 104 [Strongyloides ratti]
MAGVTDIGAGHTYSTPIGLLYVFNLIVGTGALALPKAFQTAGYALSITLLGISAFISYICATFIIEAMSVSNALICKNGKSKKFQVQNIDNTNENNENTTLQNDMYSYNIVEKVEVSEMSNLIQNRFGVFLCYLSLTIYLFGDLAIYSTTVPKSLMNVICGSVNATVTASVDSPCYDHWPIFFSRFVIYRICVILFIAFCVPMVIIGITKTKYIQLSTSISRWTAFSLMIVLASIQLMKEGSQGKPPAFDWNNFGNLFGVSVYSFMCHHSIPSLITPMRNKSNLYRNLFIIYLVVLGFYVTLSTTGAFAFKHAQDIYTLNFLHDQNTSPIYTVIDYFLALFPVFTLTTNYPIVAITLINNLRVLLEMIAVQGQSLSSNNDTETEHLLSDSENEETERERRNGDSGLTSTTTRNNRSNKLFSNVFIPLIAIALPTMLSLSTENVLLLACITGSYPGVGVQFIIPCLVVIGARTVAKKQLNQDIKNSLASPFQHAIWPYIVLLWSGFALINVTINLTNKIV